MHLVKIPACVLAFATLLSVPIAGAHFALGVLAGGVWNLVNLWCLSHLLGRWLGSHPSKRHVIGWLIVKFPLLYAAAFLVLWYSLVPAVGFGIGFSVVLASAVALFAVRGQHMVSPTSHGR